MPYTGQLFGIHVLVNLVYSIEVLNAKVVVKKTITLLLSRTNIKVLKDALAC